MPRRSELPCKACNEYHGTRNQTQMAELRQTIYETLEAQHPQTLRGLFYQLVTKKVICKTEAEYKNSVIKIAGEMREDDKLPWYWIVDTTRDLQKAYPSKSVTEALEKLGKRYEGDMWRDQKHHVQLWSGKATLSGLVAHIANEWQVPFLSTGGFCSKTALHDAAMLAKETGKPTYIYLLEDFDPSGQANERALEASVRRYAPDVEFHFKKLAVLREHIEQYQLPTRPTKTKDNSHVGEDDTEFWNEHDSVEVDALPANILEEIVTSAIGPTSIHLDHTVIMDIRREAWAVSRALKICAPDVQKMVDILNHPESTEKDDPEFLADWYRQQQLSDEEPEELV